MKPLRRALFCCLRPSDAAPGNGSIYHSPPEEKQVEPAQKATAEPVSAKALVPPPRQSTSFRAHATDDTSAQAALQGLLAPSKALHSSWGTRLLHLLKSIYSISGAAVSVYGLVEVNPGQLAFVLVARAPACELAGCGPPPLDVLQRVLDTQKPVVLQEPLSRALVSSGLNSVDSLADTSRVPSHHLTCGTFTTCAVPLFEGNAVAGALVLEAEAPPPPPGPSMAAYSQPQQAMSLEGGAVVDSTVASSVAATAPLSQQQRQEPAAAIASAAAAATPPRPLAPLLTDVAVLQQLGLAASVCGLGSDAEQLRWTAAALARVAAANSMHALVHELCADVAAHVRRRFFVTASVRAALLPHPDAAVGLLFHPQQPGSSLTVRTSRDGRYAATGSTLELTASHTALRSARSSVEVPGGAAYSPLAPPPAGVAGCSVIAIIPGAGANSGAGTGGGGASGTGCRLAQLSSMASRQRLNMLMNTGGSSECGNATRFSRQQQHLATAPAAAPPTQPPHPQQQQQHGALSHCGIDVSGLTNTSSARALVLSTDATAVTATANITAPAFATSRPTDPTLLPTGTLSAATNVNSGGGFAMAASSAENVASANQPSTPAPSRAIVVQLPQNLAPDSVPAPSLHAQAFPLKHTMLHALAVSLQQQALSCADSSVAEDTDGVLFRPGFRGSCVEDVAQYVQNVHNPSRDVCLLAGGAGIGASNGGRMGSSLGTVSPRALGSHCPSPFTVLPTTLQREANSNGPAHGPQVAAAQAAAAAANATAAAGLSTLTMLGGTTSLMSGGLQSLLLVGLRHGQAVLAMYMCFSKRLPAELLEAARISCQEMLDQMFLEPVCAKLDGSLAPEFETLRSTTPGHFAVLRPGSANGMFGHQLLGGGGSSLTGVTSQPPGLAGGSGLQHHLSLNLSMLGMLPHSHSQGPHGLQMSGGRPTSQSGLLSSRLNQAPGASGAAHIGAAGLGGALPRTQSSIPRFCGGTGGAGVGDGSSGPAATSVIQALRRGAAGRAQGLAEAGVTGSAAGEATATAAGGMPDDEAAAVRDLNRTGTSPAVMAASAMTQAGVTGRRGSLGGPAVVCCSILSNLEGATITGTGGLQTPTKGMPRTVSFNMGDAGLTPTGGVRTGPMGTPQGRYNSGSNNVLQRHARGPSGALVPMEVGDGSAGAVASGAEPQTLGTNEDLMSAVVVPPEAQLALCGGADGEGAFVMTGNSAGLETAGSASIMTVVGVETGASMRQQLDLLLTSIHTTMTAEVVNNGVVAAHADDLEQLELVEVLGKGGGGVVYRGRMGTQEVAVKVMELPDVDAGETAGAGQQQQQQQHAQGSPSVSPSAAAHRAAGGAGGNSAGGLLNPANAAALAKEQLRARRALLRNAMEMAVQVRVSHPNVIQVYATYSNVLVEQRLRPDGSSYGCLVSTGQASSEQPSAGLSGPSGPTHCAIVTELADGGSLAALLTARLFPRVVVARGGPVQGDRHPFTLDLRGVYMVLLDVALALRHLHSMNLVHRDLKPANLLLKSNARDYRGFTVKLADFGFVLHMSEVAEDGTRYVMVDQACGTVTHMAPELLPGRARVEASADVYSFGILCWELVAGGVRPFPQLHPDLIPRHVYKGARPTFSESIPFTYRALAQACWAADPSRRPKASDLVAVITNQLQELESSGY